jgi:hypothetical protein
MLYAILCYKREDEVFGWTEDQDAAVMARLDVVHKKLESETRFGPSLRLMPTTAATTLRTEGGGGPPVILDGPFAETKEQLLGFYVMEAEGLEQALDACRQLSAVNPGGAYEVRPVLLYVPGNGEEAAGA